MQQRMQQLAILACGGLFALPLASCADTRVDDSRVVRVDAAAVADLVQRDRPAALLVDVRPDAAFAQGSLPGAVNIRLEHLQDPRIVDRLRRAPRIIVFGQNPGSAAAMAMAKRLMSLGMKDVQLFAAGYDAWRRLNPQRP